MHTNNQLITTDNCILPQDGIAIYYGPILPPPEANQYYTTLFETISWKSDEVVIFGRHLITARKVAWYGDEAYNYCYSGKNKTALKWTNELSTLKTIVETHLQMRFNSCLLNLYHNGNEGMGWHSDDEKMLEENPTIASISLGAERKFSFRHKHTRQTLSLLLEHGSLLVMKGSTQTYWHHCLPKSKKIAAPRINLTFRTIAPNAA